MVSESNQASYQTARQKISALDVSIWILSIISIVLYLLAAIVLMAGPDFNDETEKLIASRLMQEGLRLYKDIFVQHGPFVYMLSHLFDIITGNRELYWPRLIPISLSLFSILAIAASPVLQGARSRLFAASAAAIAYMALLPIYSLVMTMYQVYSGFLFTIPLALAFVPAIVGIRLERWHLIISGAALAAIGLSAISFGVAIALTWITLLMVSLPHMREVARTAAWTFVGALGTAAVVAAWMVFFADFIGYYIDHVYINLTVYRSYLSGQSFLAPFSLIMPGQLWVNVVPDKATTWYELVLFSLPFFLMVGLLIMALQRAFRPWWHSVLVVVLFYLGFIYLNPRYQVGFGASVYVIAISAFAIIVAIPLCRNRWMRLPSIALILVLLGSGLVAQTNIKTSLYELPVATYYMTHGPLFERNDKEFELARTILSPDDGVLQVPFDLYKYVWVGRKPASGIFFWMPWMHDYNEKPILGRSLDLCASVNAASPKIIYFNNYGIWNKPTDNWMGCLKEIVRKRYISIGALGNDAVVRADIVATRPDLIKSAMITQDLDLSLVTPDQAAVLRGQQLSFAELSHGGLCLTDIGQPGGNGSLSSKSCDIDIPVTIEKRDLVFSLVKNNQLNTCLTRIEARKFRFQDCTGDKRQEFLVQMMADSALEIRNDLSSIECVVPTISGLVSSPCTGTTRWTPPQHQQFAARTRQDGSFELLSRLNGWCVEAVDKPVDNMPLRLWPCTGAGTQAFYVETSVAGTQIRNVQNGLCIALSELSAVMQTCNAKTQFALRKEKTNSI